MLSPHLYTDLSRFHAQADAFARLDHPNIARLFDRGVTHDGVPYYTQPGIVRSAMPLACWWGKNGWSSMNAQTLSLPGRVRLLADACRALDTVDQAGFADRD